MNAGVRIGMFLASLGAMVILSASAGLCVRVFVWASGL
jgi:hypothetical protein